MRKLVELWESLNLAFSQKDRNECLYCDQANSHIEVVGIKAHPFPTPLLLQTPAAVAVHHQSTAPMAGIVNIY
jgi:hypothetical protein